MNAKNKSLFYIVDIIQFYQNKNTIIKMRIYYQKNMTNIMFKYILY